MLKSTLPAPTALGISGAIVSTYRISVKPSARRCARNQERSTTLSIRRSGMSHISATNR